MPQHGKIKKVGKCDCGGDLNLVIHNDGHGLETPMEIHCNQCRFSVDGEGNLRNPPTNKMVLKNAGLEFSSNYNAGFRK